MFQNKVCNMLYLLVVICIYFSYFFYGMSVIILVQNMIFFVQKFFMDSVGIVYLIFGIGFGCLVSILFFGVLFDKFGCWVIILFGVVLYMLFFFGIFVSFNLMIVFILVVCVGVVNFVLDIGGYFVLMECFFKVLGLVVILVKVMVFFG